MEAIRPFVDRHSLGAAVVVATAKWATSQAFPVSGLGRPVSVDPHGPSDARPISMAMHLHASFSERTASYEAHLAEARRLGVDVLWWTDHDNRLTGHGLRHGVRFDGLVEFEGDPELTWTWVEQQEGQVTSAGCEFIREPRSPDETGRAMRLHATGGARAPGTLWYLGDPWNRRCTTSLTGTTVEIDVLPESLGPNDRFVLEIQLSYHPASDGRPAGLYRLRYHVGSPGDRHHLSPEDPLMGIIEVPAHRHRWNRLSLRPVDDIARLWPDQVASDNALSTLRIGLHSAGQDTARVVVDRLRFDRDSHGVEHGLRSRRSVLEQYASRFTDVRHYEALEMSWTRHVNWFGERLALPDYADEPLTADFAIDRTGAMIDLIHQHGGLASFNHPMMSGYGPPNDPVGLSDLVLRTNALGADIVELGHRRKLEDLLYVLDVAARNAVFFTGTGVTDDHTAEDWIDQPFNYLTHVWSPSTQLPDLLNSLRRGQAWFADAGAWRGAMDVAVSGIPAMGRAVSGAARRVSIAITATDLPVGSALEVIAGPVDRAGTDHLEPAVTSRPILARALRGGLHKFDFEREPSGSYLRTQVRDASGRIVAAGNPVWLLPASSTIDVPEARQLRC